MLPVKEILDKIVSSYQDILQKNLVGIYLHGSLAMNCFNPYSSDIDFLVIVKEKPNFIGMRQLINTLIQLSNEGPKGGFEMSVMLEENAKNFKYPTPFILHYSNYHKEKYLKQEDYICGDSEDFDLAAHIVILRERGICLNGQLIQDVFQAVPEKYYIESIKNDIITSKEDIINNPVYFILNLCRVLCFLKAGEVCSKTEGGQWAYKNLPRKYTDIIQGALDNYNNNYSTLNIESERLIDFADFMMKEIEIIG